MPLQDSFKRKTAKPVEQAPKPRINSLQAVPTLEDLRYSLVTAQENLRQPVVLTWKVDGQGPTQLLTVTRDSENYEPTWVMHLDQANNVVLLWSYCTADAELIYSLLTEQVKEVGPAAVIPESLRPGAVEAKPAANVIPKEHDTAFGETYKILNTIGSGGMGTIYKAVHLESGNYVALKVLHPHLVVDPVSVQRFEQEAQTASALRHPNLISVREFGFSPQGHPFIAMDYLEGVELQSLLGQCNHLEVPAFINIFTQLCEALSHAHDKGLVHRDIKPGNIMLVKGTGGQETVKIIDFGIAKMLTEQAGRARLTSTGELLGSPAYMSPEQCGGAVLDARSDIYSLGCVMYEAITGELPFQDSSVVKTIMMQINQPARPFKEVRPDLTIPQELENLIFKAMEKDPSERFQTAGDLHTALWEFAASGATGTPSETKNGGEPRPFVLEQIAMSPKVYTLLRRAGVITDEVLRVAERCETLIEKKELTIEQAIAIIENVVFVDEEGEDASAERGS